MTTQSPSKQTTSSPVAKRCVNLDWLEVHAREPISEPHDAQYFRDKGYAVNERIHKEQIGELRQLVGMLGRTIQNQPVLSTDETARFSSFLRIL